MIYTPTANFTYILAFHIGRYEKNYISPNQLPLCHQACELNAWLPLLFVHTDDNDGEIA
jgi:hypothetical protein